jgi:hypothetical protein
MSRQPAILAKLSEDASAEVRHAVAENPNTPPETLNAMCRALKVPIMMFGFDEAAGNAVRLLSSLSNNPRLPADAIQHVAEKEHDYRFFEEQAHLPPELMVERLRFDHDDEDAADFIKCRSYFPWMKVADRVNRSRGADASEEHWSERLIGRAMGRSSWIAMPMIMVAMFGMTFRAKKAAVEIVRESGGDASVMSEPSPETIQGLFTHMLASGNYTLREAALKNVRCPDDELLRAVRHYLANASDDDKGGLRYTIRDIARNPGLPPEARALLVDHVKADGDHEVLSGLLRNPSVSVKEWRDMAVSLADPSRQQDARQALWIWHGETLA